MGFDHLEKKKKNAQTSNPKNSGDFQADLKKRKEQEKTKQKKIKLEDVNKNRKVSNFYGEPVYFKNQKYVFNFLEMEYDIIDNELRVKGEVLTLTKDFKLRNKNDREYIDRHNDSGHKPDTIISDLRKFIRIEEKKRKNINEIKLDDQWINTRDGVFTSKGKEITHKPITYLCIEVTTNDSMPANIIIKLGDNIYQGPRTILAEKLCNKGEVCDKGMALKLIEMLNFKNQDKQVMKNEGGYLDVEQLPKEKPELFIDEKIKEFVKSMNHSQRLGFKLALLLPYSDIIRKVWVIARGVVKALLLYGAAGGGKTVTLNLNRNMYTDETISLLDGGNASSSVALRNGLSTTIGIFLCDEADGKLIDKNKKTFYPDVEAIIKGIYQNKPPRVSDQNNQGHLLDQEIFAVPAFTMNDYIYPTEALKDRLDMVNYDDPNELPLLDIDEIKDSLLSMGRSIAYVFGKNIEELRKITDNMQVINTLLKKCEEEYDIDLSFLINTNFKAKEIERSITTCVHNSMVYKLDSKIVNSDIDTAFQENWVKFDSWIEHVSFDTDKNPVEVIVNQTEFINFVKSAACLNDGSISSKKIMELLRKESGLELDGKNKSMQGKKFKALIFDYDDFIEVFNLTSKRIILDD